MAPTRRDVVTLLAGATALGNLASSAPAKGEELKPAHDLASVPPSWHGADKIAFLIYPQFTALDMVGPHYMLTNLLGAKTYVVAKNRTPVLSDTGLLFTPDTIFEDCPDDLEVLCIPGGTSGTLAALTDRGTIRFVRERGLRARYVTSVCTGSLLLGAAGLLKGYRATSHWLSRDMLAEFGATPINERVVADRNRLTGAGVTAGLDLGLRLVALMRDDRYGEAVQLLAEYDPQPPFNSGTMEKASPENRAMYDAMFSKFRAELKAAITRIATSPDFSEMK